MLVTINGTYSMIVLSDPLTGIQEVRFQIKTAQQETLFCEEDKKEVNSDENINFISRYTR